jgi:hypothetical protein
MSVGIKKPFFPVMTPVWWFCLVLGLIFQGVYFGGIPIRQPSPTEIVRSPSFIQYLEMDARFSDKVFIEQATLLDSMPLFLPTRWNASSDYPQSLSLLRPEELFTPYSPELSLTSVDYQKLVAMEPISIETPIGLVDNALENPFHWMGLDTVTEALVVSGSASMQVVKVGSKEPLFTQPLDLKDLGLNLMPILWEPVTLVFELSNYGAIGRPTVVYGSGIVVLDAALVAYCGHLDFYHSLDQGYYFIRIQP